MRKLITPVGEGIRLRAARERAGLSQAALAEKIGINQSSISCWEKGEYTPSRESAEKLRQVLRFRWRSQAMLAAEARKQRLKEDHPGRWATK